MAKQATTQRQFGLASCKRTGRWNPNGDPWLSDGVLADEAQPAMTTIVAHTSDLSSIDWFGQTRLMESLVGLTYFPEALSKRGGRGFIRRSLRNEADRGILAAPAQLYSNRSAQCGLAGTRWAADQERPPHGKRRVHCEHEFVGEDVFGLRFPDAKKDRKTC